jgi:YVTN family beta-propeller protein
VATIPVGSAPEGLALSPDATGSTLYVANSYDNTISVIDTASRSVRAQVPCGNFPAHIAIAPGGNPMYVTNRTSGTVAVIDTVTLRQVNQFQVGRYPWYISLSPDGGTAYITDVYAGLVYLLSTSSGAVISQVTVGAAPWGILANPDPGNPVVYTVNTEDGVLTYLNTDGGIAKTVSLGLTSYPHEIALSPAFNSLLVPNGSSLNWYRTKPSSPRPDGSMTLGGSPRSVATIKHYY